MHARRTGRQRRMRKREEKHARASWAATSPLHSSRHCYVGEQSEQESSSTCEVDLLERSAAYEPAPTRVEKKGEGRTSWGGAAASQSLEWFFLRRVGGLATRDSDSVEGRLV